MASSPAFLFNLMFPMSDIVTASLWTWAMALLTWPRASAALAAGAAAGLAVIVRPNLVPLAVPGAAAAALGVGGQASPSQRALRVVAFAAGIVPAALFVAAVNNALYGLPLQSGYGGHRPRDTRSRICAPTSRSSPPGCWRAKACSPPSPRFPPTPRGSLCYPRGLIDGSGVADRRVRRDRRRLVLIYLPFDQWWYLRFLLPAFPLLFRVFSSLVAITPAVSRDVGAVGRCARRCTRPAGCLARRVRGDA